MAELYLKYEFWIAAFQLTLAMFGMGATLTPKDFRDVLTEPRAFSIGTIIQLLVVPLIAFIFIKALNLHSGLAVGIALIAAVPGGTVSNVFTYFARGNSALSISLTSITTVLCLLLTPLILSLLISKFLPADFTMPHAKMIKDIALTLLVPLILGMVFLRFFPTIASSISKWCIRGSLIGIVLIVIGSYINGRLNMSAFGYQNMAYILLFLIALVFINQKLPKLLGLSYADATAIEFEVVFRNINLGILLNASIFPAAVAETAQLGNIVLLSLLLFGFAEMFIAAPLIWLKRRNKN
ncbi:bile acid:sodium symporter family protein [Shewanella aestuarii]|uniref:Bile acid:sodium symporter family protein n=1 Tax=Shewanella aestuarii TaxID=1028752 RepID=A0A6G9QLQ0_9GAMM|nr:bile acid:sodium symporter family protein [Shewanella aestuarii]QIR14995.1 bile acid:sodium symporter family protein [Shewanella aestuarii]